MCNFFLFKSEFQDILLGANKPANAEENISVGEGRRMVETDSTQRSTLIKHKFLNLKVHIRFLISTYMNEKL